MRICIVALVALFVAVAQAASQKDVVVVVSNDRVHCSTVNKTVDVPSDRCLYQWNPHCPLGSTWDCGQQISGTCFSVYQYPLGSNCTGAPVTNRHNFCDECKGQEPTQGKHMQSRKCHFARDGTVKSVGYHNCSYELRNLTCANCEAAPAITFSVGECVEYQGSLHMLQPGSRPENCRLLKHVCWQDTKCKRMMWGDHIIVNGCNDGYMFTCPGFPSDAP